MPKKNNYLSNGFHPIRKIKVILEGFIYVMRYDFSVSYKMLISAVLLVLAMVQSHNFNALLLIITTGNMVSIELMNSCVELLCDFHTTEYNEKIKVIKDVAALAAGVSIMIWLVSIIIEIITLIG